MIDTQSLCLDEAPRSGRFYYGKKWSAIIFFHVWEMRNKMPTIKYVDDTKHISEYYPATNIKR